MIYHFPILMVQELHTKFVQAFGVATNLWLTEIQTKESQQTNGSKLCVSLIQDMWQVCLVTADYAPCIKWLNANDLVILKWLIYIDTVTASPVDDNFDVVAYCPSWKSSMKVPKLPLVALPVWCIECSFSKIGQISPQHHSLSDENFRGHAALHFSGDIEGILDESTCITVELFEDGINWFN